MDPKLEAAAESGDVEFLRKAVASQPPDYFLTSTSSQPPRPPDYQKNIFHLAVANRKVEFVRVALEILPITIQQKQFLLSKGDFYNWNPLHYATYSSSDSVEMVKLILDVYKSHSDPSILKPWSAITHRCKSTPLHLALEGGNEESAMEIMSMDMELLCNMLDDRGNSPLFLAVRTGCNEVAEEILMSSFSYSLSGEGGSTPLHFAPNSSENVLRLLLKKHPELVDKVNTEGYNMLNTWVEISYDVWPVEILLEREFSEVRTKVFTDLIYKTTDQYQYKNDTPLHVAALTLNNEVGKAIVKGYQKTIKEAGDTCDRCPPWRIKNSGGYTPLQTALHFKNEKFALYMLSVDSTLYQLFNKEGESPLLTAVRKGCAKFVEEILSNHHVNFSMLRAFDGSTVLHYLHNISEDVGKQLLEKYWWMIDFTNDDGITALDAARKKNISWLINLLEKPSLIQRKSFDWVTKCEKDETHFVLDFIDKCKYLHEVCHELNDTPMHHIKLYSYDEYFDLLKKPSIEELKNITDYEGATPLHRALERKDLNFVTALLDNGVEHNIRDCRGKTAMDLLAKLYEENTDWMEAATRSLHNKPDYKGNNELFVAVKNGCNQVAEMILMSTCSYSLIGNEGSTPLHFAPNSSEKVLKLLLDKHPDLMDKVDEKKYNVLHQWVQLNKIWPFELLVKEDFAAARSKFYKDLIYKAEGSQGDTPLHIAATAENRDIAMALIKGYQQEIKDLGMSIDDSAPWRTKNFVGHTPLHVAISHKNEQLAMRLINLDSKLCMILSNEGHSPLYDAILTGCGTVVEEILRTQNDFFGMLRSNDGTTVLHLLKHVPDKFGRKLLKKFWWMTNVPDNKGRTALDEASEANIPWLVNLLKKPSNIKKEPFNWAKACEKEETWAVLAFIDRCQDDLLKICREQNDTPLHHIKLQTYEDYMNLLKKPSISELKNTTDHEGATPLHRAILRKDMLLAKVLLLDDDVERNIEDYRGRNAMALLAKLVKEDKDWERMCNTIKVNPFLRTTYIHPRTNLDQMRNTLSVVAALLATITFAAGFTLPGGLNNETGSAVLANNPAFLVFLLADAYAMCTSMLVLFCQIWSMVSNRDMSYLLVDRSVFILMQALYGTMLAFMTGIYSMISHKSLWATIIIFVMCSFIGISANRTVLHNVLARLLPTANEDRQDRAQLFTERNSAEYTISEPPHNSISSARRNHAMPIESQDDEDQIRLLEEGHAFTSSKDDTKTEGASSNRLQKLG